jgi:hypothetical protein
LIEVVCAVGKPKRVVLIGSSSLLPGWPALNAPGSPLELTSDADFIMEPVNDAIAESLQLAAGQDSAFMSQFGYYADILHPSIVGTLPVGWESRLHVVPGHPIVFALDRYDLALVKLVTGREKDLELVRALLRLGILDPAGLRRHYQDIPLGERESLKAGRNLTAVLAERP